MSEKAITITCVPCPGCGEDVTASRALTEPWQCARCDAHDWDRRAAWVAFCVGALSWEGLGAPKVADTMLEQYDARFPKRRK